MAGYSGYLGFDRNLYDEVPYAPAPQTDYAQRIMQYAGLGSMGGPQGAAIGAGIGALATMMSAEAEAEENRKKNLIDILNRQAQGEQTALQGMGNMWSRIL